MTRFLYRLLGLRAAWRAAERGPAALARQRTRAAVHRHVARAMKRSRTLRP